MKQEVKKAFTPTMTQINEGKTLVDATLGFGGHAIALLQFFGELHSLDHSAKEGIVVHGVDADRHMLEVARERLQAYGEVVHFHNQFFDDYFSTTESQSADMILMDLGVSMFHFKGAARGFSIHDEGVLDMRLSAETPLRATDVLNEYSTEEISELFYTYGEERQAMKWVRRIVEARKTRRIETPSELLEVLQLGKKPSDRSILARIFQSLRIEVNDELERIRRSLPTAWETLRPGGRMAIITFHSLEDRIVKRFSRHIAGKLKNSPEVPMYEEELIHSGYMVNKKPIVPSDEEIEENSASKSAKLRILEKKV